MRIFDKSIESNTVSLLRSGNMRGSQIITELRKIFPKITKQAIYQILRRLRDEEVVVVFKKNYMLSEVFLDKAIEFFETAKSSRQMSSRAESFLNLSDGDSISYNFKNPYFTDQFWAHAFIVLSQSCKKEIPVRVYNPHEWFFITRESSEKSVFESLRKAEIPALVLIGNTDPIDISIKKSFENKLLQYHAKQMPQLKNNYYLNIFGDYLIEVWLDSKISKTIDDWYKKTKILTDEARTELQTIISKEGKSRMRISRNKKRASRLMKLFKKDFSFYWL